MLTSPSPECFINGENGLTLIFQHPVSDALSSQIQQFSQYCRTHCQLPLTEVIPAYQSLTVYAENQTYTAIKTDVMRLLYQFSPHAQIQGRKIEIPVCYHPSLAPDLPFLCQHTGLTEQQIIEYHCAPVYLVHMLGFLPGFAYLGGLDTRLHCPRKTNPDLALKAGSVAIGGSQTGIYPVNSPGGWHVIGQTPLKLFQPNSKQALLLQAMDQIHFVSIELAQFENWKN